MKTDYDAYKRANAIKESWPEKTPLAPRDKVFIVLLAVLVVVPVLHLLFCYGGLSADISPLGGGGLRDSDPKWLILVIAFCDVLCFGAMAAQIAFPSPIFLADELIRRPAKELITGLRLASGISGVTLTLFFGYVIETTLLGVDLSTGVCVVAVAVLLLELLVFFRWLRHTPDDKNNTNDERG